MALNRRSLLAGTLAAAASGALAARAFARDQWGFGGPNRNRLFMTGLTSLYAVYVNAVGAPLG
jgi:hypothetical protein